MTSTRRSAGCTGRTRRRRTARRWRRRSCPTAPPSPGPSASCTPSDGRGDNVARPVSIPRLGWTMEEGTFGGWLKADGEPVRVGEELFVLESDKANEPVQALDEGVLRIAPGGPKAGDGVRVGQGIGYLVAEGEALPVEAPAAPRG